MLVCQSFSSAQHGLRGLPCGGLGACLEVQISELFLMLVYRLAGSSQRARIAGFHGEVWVHVIRLQFRSRS